MQKAALVLVLVRIKVAARIKAQLQLYVKVDEWGCNTGSIMYRRDCIVESNFILAHAGTSHGRLFLRFIILDLGDSWSPS